MSNHRHTTGIRGALSRAIAQGLQPVSHSHPSIRGAGKSLLHAGVLAALTFTSGVSLATPATGTALLHGIHVASTASIQAGERRPASERAQTRRLPDRTNDSVNLRLQQDVFDPLRRAPSVSSRLSISAPRGGSDFYLVQYAGPVSSDARAELERAGVTVLDYVPDFAFVVKAKPSAMQSLSTHTDVRWTGLYQPAFRLERNLLNLVERANVGSSVDISVRLFQGESDASLQQLLATPGVSVLSRSPDSGGGAVLRLQVPEPMLGDLANVPEVAWIEPIYQRKYANAVARSNQIMRKDYVENTLGLYGANQGVAVGDTGVSTGVPGTMRADFAGRVLGGNTGPTSTCNNYRDTDGHGTHVAGSVLGSGLQDGADIGNHAYTGTNAGVAPEALLYAWGFCADFSGLGPDLYNDYYQPIRNADPRVRISTNSWGYTSGQGNYNIDTRDSDRFMHDNPDMLLLFAAGNEGADGNADGVVDAGSTNMPGTAKNVVTVGASENYRLTGGYNPGGACQTWGGCWPGDYSPPVSTDRLSDNINGMVAFSSRGPVNDGRLKPDVVAPGSNIVSTRYEGTGTQWGVYSASYLYQGGTSMATPLVAGAAAIVREFYQVRHALPSPSGALIKATLINGAADMSPGQYGPGATQDVTRRPDINQGWGRVDLQNSLVYEDTRALWFRDEAPGLNTGERFTARINVTDTSMPLRVSLVWTDKEGTEASYGALVNDLDLTLTSPGNTVFTGNDGVDGVIDGAVDRINPLEGIDVLVPEAGEWTINVSGYNVPFGAQRFALVVTGGVEEPPFRVVATSASDQICVGDTAAFDLDISLGQPGFNAPVALASIGHPAGTSPSFSVNNQPAPFTSVLSLGNTAAIPVGDHAFRVEGSSGTDVGDTDLYLKVFGQTPAAFALNTPANNSFNVSARPTLSWNAASGATLYKVDVATDAAFTNVVHTDTLPGTSATVTGLAFDTQYVWRVSAINPCGGTASSETFTFTTVPQPTVLVVDDSYGGGVLANYTVALDAIVGPGNYAIRVTADEGEPVAADLAPYSRTIWFSGDIYDGANSYIAGPNPNTEIALGAWLDAGACLFISSQDYRYDRGSNSTFMTNYLGGTVPSQDISMTSIVGSNVYAGLGPYPLTAYPAGFEAYPDRVNVSTGGAGKALGMTYNGGANGTMTSRLSTTPSYFTTFAAFALEGVAAPGREAILQRFFDTCPHAGNTFPVANNDSVTVDEGGTVTVLDGGGTSVKANDTDEEDGIPGGDVLLFSGVSHGSLTLNVDGTFSYTHDGSETTSDSFSYHVKDSDGYVSNPATVSITINPVNTTPVANAQAVTTQYQTGVAITLTGSDADGDILTFTIATPPVHGELVGTAPTLTYLPDAGFSGSDSFTFTVSDGALVSAPATVDITVSPAPNAAPVFADAPYAFHLLADAADGALAGTVSATDADGDDLAFAITAGNPDGIFTIDADTGAITLAAAGDLGAEGTVYTLTVSVTDGNGGSDTATVTVTVRGLALFEDGFED